MRSRFPIAQLALVAGLLAVALLPGATRASDEEALRQLNQATLEALASGDAQAAVRAAETALAAGRAMTGPPTDLFAYAVNNLAYALSRARDGTGRAETLWAEALLLLDREGGIPGGAWLTVMINLASHDVGQGRVGEAHARIGTMLERARGTAFHGRALGAASAFHFTNRAYPAAIALLEELLAVEPELLRGAYGEVYVAYSTAQEQAEQDGRTEDAVALIEGKIALLRKFRPEAEAEPAVKELLFQKYYQAYQAGDYGPAAEALAVWGRTGSISEENRAFIEQMASLALEFTQVASYGTQRSTQLGYAELAVVFAELLDAPTDPRLGLALRELALAQSNLGRVDSAAQTLRRAADLLRRTPEGRKSLHLLLADLAANAWLRADYPLAEEFYARAERAYATALENGAPPLQEMDLAIDATNRAHLLVDMGRPEDALVQTGKAWALWEADAAGGEQKWNAEAQAARILSVAAVAESDLGRREAAIATLRKAETIARETMPDDHPDLALTLSNAADLLFVLDERQGGLKLLQEAVSINREALPETAPQRVEGEVQLALHHLTHGNREAAIDQFRRVARARKSPVYRAQLSEAADNFELLAWLLLRDAGTRSPVAIDEALDALQWTQTTRSAEALSMLEARLALDDPGQAAVLQRRQDLLQEHARLSSQILAAYAADDPGRAGLDALTARLAEVESGLSDAEGALAALGLDLAGIGGIRPLSVAEVQGYLTEDEALVTFLLPSLKPEMVPGLEASSNLAIAITRDRVEIAAVAERSRRVLAERVAAFRCDMAVNDRSCTFLAGSGLRGAMTSLSDDDGGAAGGAAGSARGSDGDRFDFAAGHALYRDLLAGIEAAIAAKTHLIIVPPADLLRLPFQALITDEESPRSFADADWLIRRHAVSVLPSIASLRSLRGRPDAPGGPGLEHYVGFGDPVIGSAPAIDCAEVRVAALRAAPFSSDHMKPAPDANGLLLADSGKLAALPRLPDSACELRAIAQVFAGRDAAVYLGPDARESKVKALEAEGRLAEADVLVFATHGLTAGEAGASAPGLVLTPPDRPSADDDGLLTAAEIATFSLGAKLVVMSACNTAAGEVGDDDGLSGLARAFFHAGASSILVTHWSVYSSAAVDVSTRLVAALTADPGQAHAQALRTAVLDLLADPDPGTLRHRPGYWAPFAIVGANRYDAAAGD